MAIIITLTSVKQHVSANLMLSFLLRRELGDPISWKLPVHGLGGLVDRLRYRYGP